MKFILPILVLFYTYDSHAILSPDFLCVSKIDGNKSIEIRINNIDMGKEVLLMMGSKRCTMNIQSGNFNQVSVVPQMLMNLVRNESCSLESPYKLLDKGFLKVAIHAEQVESHILLLVGHQPLPCDVKIIKLKKLENRIKNLWISL